MLEILKYVLWTVAMVIFISSGWFLKVLSGLAGIISDSNVYFWAKLTSEMQILFLGLIGVLIFGFIRVFTRD